MGTRSAWLLAIGALFCTADAVAQWVPQWIGVWQHPEPFHDPAPPTGVRVGADDSVFALVSTGHHNSPHATLMRFERDGRFTWLREGAADHSPLGIELLEGGGVAVASRTTQVDEYDRVSGELIRHCEWGGVSSGVDDRYETHPLAQSAQGDLLFAAKMGEMVDAGDFVVLRCDRNGSILPAWHWPSTGHGNVTGILAFADGGAALTGFIGVSGGAGGGGYYTVRFDADGQVAFVDRELGDLGSPPSAPGHLSADANGALLLAAAPENFGGSFSVLVWKVLPDGRRAWTTRVPDPPNPLAELVVNGFAVTPEGDAIVAVTTPFLDLRVVRISGADGSVLWRTEVPVTLAIDGLALAANGRILVSGHAWVGASGTTYARLAELAPDGQVLRVKDDFELRASRIASGCAGWYVLGAEPYDPVSGGNAVVKQYDAGVGDLCQPETPVFADGFDGSGGATTL